MFTEERCHYAVLTQPHRKRPGWHTDRKVAIILAVVIFPVIIFFISYMLLSEFHPHFVYPVLQSENLERQLRRAVIYSRHQLDNQSIEHARHINTKPSKHADNFKLVCYYNFPDSPSSLQVKDLDPFLCTHINGASAGVKNNTLYMTELQLQGLEELVKLKEVNEGLKVLVSVGGGGNDGGFSEMVLNHTNRKSFIQSVLYYVEHYGIDGIDLDWEFPNENHGEDGHQKMHFTQLLGEFRKAINRHPRYRFLLTVAVAAPYLMIEPSYDVPYMNEYVDFINLMSYDYHFYTKLTPFTGFNSPLYPSGNEDDYLATLNINFSSNYWNHMGMDRKKILVGLPTYAHTFRLVNPDNNITYAPASGYGRLGSLGFASYPDVCTFLSSNRVSAAFDVDARSPYASKNHEWISFDDGRSLTYKTEFIRENGFGGAMVYALNADDFASKCVGGTGKFPLVNNIKNALFRNKSDSS